MRIGKLRSLPDPPDEALQDLTQKPTAHIRSRVEHPFRLIKQQFRLSEDSSVILGNSLRF
jgi:IS5 family transposase